MTSNNKELTVLCLNGRRVTIKSSATTSIGQVIEEACLKQNLDPLNYTVKHLRRVLDPSSTIQYSNIPNRAQLELIEAEKRRQELNVTVSLVTEDGQRLIADFPSNTTLENVLVIYESNPENKFSLPTVSSGTSPFIVYTMKKIDGEKLKSETLKSLGLYSGRCIMRYGTQQILPENCSESSSSPIVIVQKKTEECSTSFPDLSDKNSSAEIISEPMDCDAPQIQEVVEASATSDVSVKTTEDHIHVPNNVISEDSPILHQPESSCGSSVEEHAEISKTEITDKPIDNSLSEHCDKLDQKEVIECETSLEEKDVPEVEMVASNKLLSDDNFILFHEEEAPKTVHEEENDEFFELSREEVVSLHQEKIRQLHELEEAPLMTKQLRELEKDSRLLLAMNKFPITRIRIVFPDRYVIQASFKPRNTIRDVMNFLRPLLIRSNLNFYLSSTYPNKKIEEDLSLVEAKCIPNARLHFKCDETVSSLSFLNQETLSKKSTYQAAANSVSKSKSQRPPSSRKSDGHSLVSSKPVKKTSSEAQHANQSQSSTQKPKWFKMGK